MVLPNRRDQAISLSKVDWFAAETQHVNLRKPANPTDTGFEGPDADRRPASQGDARIFTAALYPDVAGNTCTQNLYSSAESGKPVSVLAGAPPRHTSIICHAGPPRKHPRPSTVSGNLAPTTDHRLSGTGGKARFVELKYTSGWDMMGFSGVYRRATRGHSRPRSTPTCLPIPRVPPSGTWRSKRGWGGRGRLSGRLCRVWAGEPLPRPSTKPLDDFAFLLQLFIPPFKFSSR